MPIQATPVQVLEQGRQEAGFGPEPALLRSILFPSDLTPESDRAFDHARLLAERFNARLTLCHFVDGRRFAGAVRGELVRRAHETALDHLEGLTEGLTVRHHSIFCEAGDVARGLVRLIRATRPDLTVMATHGRTGLAHLLLGSVAEHALRASGRPVLGVREPAHGVALPYRRLLVPTDLSDSSRRAFPLVALLARAFDAEVVAVHAATSPNVMSLAGMPDVVERQVPSPDEVRAFLEPDLGDLRLAVRVPWGPPEEAILETAREEKVDLIVMSTRGHDSLGDRLRGSHTERVVRLSPCPVLAL